MSFEKIRDQMTAKERMSAFFEGKPIDRIPCNLFVGEHASKLTGAKISDLHLSVEKAVEAQVAAYEVYETEGTGVGPGLSGIAEAIGSKVFYPDHNTPYIREFAIKENSDLDRLTVPDPAKAGRFAIIHEINRMLQEKLGDRIPVSTGLPGAFTTAANLRGTEKFMRDLYHQPEFAHRILRLATDATIAFVEEAAKLDVNFSIADPTASGSLISQKQFKEFAFPYLKELNDVIIRFKGRGPSLHICGNSKKIWQYMADSGAGSLSLDDQIDLAEAKKAVGDRIVLVGNIKPTETMYLGTPEKVLENAKECLKKAYDNPKGYILALGCGLPFHTPPENIHALLYAARKFGKYPLNPANFN